MNLAAGSCSELRLRHCTPAWVTEPDSISKNIKRKKSNSIEVKREIKEAKNSKHDNIKNYNIRQNGRNISNTSISTININGLSLSVNRFPA